MGHPIVTEVSLAAGNVTGIATAQKLTAGAGNLNLNGSLVTAGVATLTPPRRVVVTSVGNDSGINFVVTGTGRPQTSVSAAPSLVETIVGGNVAASTTTQDFNTVITVYGSGNTAGNVTVGTGNVASGPWVPWDNYTKDFQVNCQADVISGSPTYQVEITNDDVFGTYLPSNVPFPRPYLFDSLGPITAAHWVGQIGPSPVRASRLTLTAPGDVQLTQMQQGD